jgi:cobalamin-dependent methionine synthase I
VLEEKELKTQSIIAAPLAASESMALFVCTIGQEVSRWVGTLVKDDAVKGYIADVSASLLCEKLADTMHQNIGLYAEKELKANISNRYSPGYCGWPVADQHVLFSLLPSDFCGISINEAALMHPIKSVSGIIGIGRDLSRQQYPCDSCGRNDCIASPGR